MQITFQNYDTKKEISFETDKSLIMIYGKNGVGKTTLSRNDLFEKKYVFNEDFIYRNVFNISEKGVTQSTVTKENFSGLWIGENIVEVRKEISIIIENEKSIGEEIAKIKNKNIDFFVKQGIPINWDEKVSQLIEDDFELNDKEILRQREEYIPTKQFKSSITDTKDLKEKINYLKREDLYKQLIEFIQKNKLLSQMILKEDNRYLNSLNEKINELKQQCKNIEIVEKVFKDEGIDEITKAKIQDWYYMHIEKDHCLFCGNKKIDDALKKWKAIFTNKYIEEKGNVVTQIENDIKACEEIIKVKVFEQIDEDIIEYIKYIKMMLEVGKENIEKGDYSEIEIKKISKDIKILEVKNLIDDIINYTLNQSIKDLEFFYNAQEFLKKVREEKTKKLDKMMDEEGEKIAEDISATMKELGLNKSIKIIVDRHSRPYKFTYNIENHKEIGELSDGQKHKLALAIFINSIINDDLTDKILVIDDPVVSLDISSYILFKQFLISRVIKKMFEESTKLILLTHDITYLYIQLSNIFNDPEMKNDTVIYKLSEDKIKEIPVDYIKTDDISLFKLAIDKCSNITEIKCINRITVKIFRIIIDIRLRFFGISDTSEVGVKLLPINEEIKDTLQKYSNHISRVAREKNPNLSDILKSIEYIKITADEFGMTDFITTDNIKKIQSIISENKEEPLKDDIFEMIDSIGNFLNKTTNKAMKGYVEHTRVSYTRNLIGLSLEDFFK